MAGSRGREAGGRGQEAGTDFRRPSTGPILTGDLVGGRRVLGFGHVDGPASDANDAAAGNAGTGVTHLGDRLLLDGDEHASGPPERSADPAHHPTLERTGPPPYQQIDDRHVHHADALGPGLVTAFEGLLYGPDAHGYLGALVDRLAADGHGFWLVGGVPRDLVTEAIPGTTRHPAADGTTQDLDVTGTAPAGAFRTLVDEVLTLDGDSAELSVQFSKHSLVCSVLTVRRDRRTLEYRGLGLTCMPYPATGTDLLQDARQRDLTINTLLYDPVRQLVLDPLGRALTDLGHSGQATPPLLRLALPESPAHPDVCAELLLRAAKFLIRWETRPGLDTTALRAWAAYLPSDLAARLDAGPAGLTRLAALWGEWIPGGPTAAQMEMLRGYGPAMSGLLDRLAAPTRKDVPAHPTEHERPDERDRLDVREEPDARGRPDRSLGFDRDDGKGL
ncbi:hypothetical protein BGM19_01890 [Streptomyces agglomeratus]|uniref:Poly A polymerase head domain-containing protein n=1 Tax=Streptomyces agglomeratus TaxID=285458 RepID=A0A1E5PH09_9ACTN|nr:hypothetical protein AS594_34610 [Streptomyces agglomeratus]OEJ56958.1 hypothetical protein BGM19_01890 [Streptomyces agglomeratus]